MLVHRLFIAVALFSVACLAVAIDKTDTQPAERFQYFAPTVGAGLVELKVSGKLREYYQLDASAPIEITIKGPAKLRLLSRVVLPSATDTADYSYVVDRKGGSKSLTVKHTSFRSEKTAFSGQQEGAVAESRTRTLDVPAGEQTYVISLPGTSPQRLLFRFGRNTDSFDGSKVVAMTPSEFTTQADLLTKEETLTYYRVGPGDRVVLNLVGPVTLKVLARIEFDPTMNGKQKWKVAVWEDGAVKSTYGLSAAKSEATSYKLTSTLVPSAAEVFYIDVPPGSHRYEFALPEDQRSCLMRYLLPQRQLDRE
ncbi:hypothetical protein HZB60_05235 [candidate division KSB1 bacterium]|nr:hypothetical protein [candidate division KSB1 bacterium]